MWKKSRRIKRRDANYAAMGALSIILFFQA